MGMVIKPGQHLWTVPLLQPLCKSASQKPPSTGSTCCHDLCVVIFVNVVFMPLEILRTKDLEALLPRKRCQVVNVPNMRQNKPDE